MYIENKELFDFLNITDYHKKGFTGKGITIAVFDQNFIPEEIEDFERFKGNVKPMPLISQSLKTWLDEDDDHGVMTLDVIRQIVPDAEIYFASTGFLSTFLSRAERVGTDVINVSLGLNRYAAKEASENSSAILFASAGNDDFNSKLLIPAKEKEWVAVGAGRLQNDGTVKRASYSTVGEGVEILGLSGITVKGADGNKKVFYGTSCSSPVVTGMMALYMQSQKMNRDKARKFVIENAYDMYDLGRDEKSGYGLFKLPNAPEKKEDDFVSKFKDIENHWARHDIKDLEKNGLVNGYGDNTFRPNETITRAENAVMLNRLRKELKK